MSLNRYEQLLHDYLESKPEEKRFWKARVAEVASRAVRKEEKALSLNAELWEYFEERSRSEAEFSKVREVSQGKLSMLNLSEYLLRMWSPLTRNQSRS